MFAWPKSPAYMFTSIALWLVFLAAIFGVTWGKYNGWPDLALWALALVPAVTVVIQTSMAYSLISKQDEFVRALIAKRMLAATGASITVVVAYAPFQQLLNAPEVPAWVIYPMFWGLFGILSGIIRDGGRA
jgi:hypothetical protein